MYSIIGLNQKTSHPQAKLVKITRPLEYSTAVNCVNWTSKLKLNHQIIKEDKSNLQSHCVCRMNKIKQLSPSCCKLHHNIPLPPSFNKKQQTISTLPLCNHRLQTKPTPPSCYESCKTKPKPPSCVDCFVYNSYYTQHRTCKSSCDISQLSEVVDCICAREGVKKMNLTF